MGKVLLIVAVFLLADGLAGFFATWNLDWSTVDGVALKTLYEIVFIRREGAY